MIIFYGTDFQLNLTNIEITYIKENALFYNVLYKNYTPPFTLPLDDEIRKKLGLIDLENTSGYTVKHFGKLFIDTTFEDAYLFIEVEDGNIQGNLAFGQLTMPLLETNLSELPFPLIKTSSINIWAKSIASKSYPEVSHCFPLIFDDDFDSETNYDAFEGIVNNTSSSNFVTNYIDGSGDIINRNIIVPFPYVMEILKVGFAAAGYSLIGDFPNNKANNHLVIDPKKHLESFSSATYQVYQFANPDDEYIDNGTLIYEYNKQHSVSSLGSYKIAITLNLPTYISVKKLEVKRGDEILFLSTGNIISDEIQINNNGDTTENTIDIQLLIEGTERSIENYNNFEFTKSEGNLNIFKNIFSLAEFMPDITFGTFLNKLRNWLNLKIVFSDSYVRIDYVENKFLEVDFKDETDFEVKKPKREFNQAKVYKLKYSDDNYIYVDKTGQINNISSYRDEDIIEIDMSLEVLTIESRNNIFTAVRSDNDFSLFLYNGTDANGYPVASETVEGKTFKLQEVQNLYWKNWLNFRTNSETYTDTFKSHALEDFKINEGRFKYNKKHIYKSIKQTRLSETQWKVEIESETF